MVILKVALMLLHMQLHMKAVDIIKDDDMLHVGEFVSINIVSSLCFVHCGLCIESIITAQVNGMSMKAFYIVHINSVGAVTADTNRIIKEYANVFQGLGCLEG